MPLRPFHALIGLATLLTAACGDPAPNLPPGWEDAELVREMTQSECVGEPGTAGGNINVVLAPTTIDVTWENAQFRCEQDVEVYLKRLGATHELLVQPVEMEPETVARCNCLYDLDFRYNASAEVQTVTLFQRIDEYSGPAALVRVGTVNRQEL